MVIDFSRFVKDKIIVAPVIDGWGKFEGRKFDFPNTKDGWYQITLGNISKIERPASPLEVYKTLKNKKHYLVFAYGDEGIPINFDNFKQLGLGETVRVNFFTLPLFSVGKVVLWDDGRFVYFDVENRIHHEILGTLRQSLEPATKESSVGKGKKVDDGGRLWSRLKGITPEMGYYTLLVNLTTQAFREVEKLDKLVLSPEEKEKRVKQFANTLEGRLKKIIEDSGGEFIDYKQSRGKSLLVTWKIGDQTVKSQIEGDTFQIISAGFCLSGDDRRHNISSLPLLAREFQKDLPLYITRE